jgi:hypothetical protein
VSKELGKRLEMRFPLLSGLRIIDPFFSRPFLDELGEGRLTGIIAYPARLERRYERQ